MKINKKRTLAPVLITVCNRDNHFKRCMESLINCYGFEDTEVYIAIDYPPNRAYEEGYKKVIEYISNLVDNFDNIHPIIRSSNVGVLENYVKLIDEILNSRNYEKYIYLEDDSEVSRNFLEFCNYCLMRYEYNEEICGICGSSQVWYGEGFVENSLPREDYLRKMQLMWHGYATWKKEYEKLLAFCDDFEQVFLNRNLIRIHRNFKCYFYSLIDRFFSVNKQLPWANNKVYPIDFSWVMYMICNEKYVVFPAINKVRDWGMDGSGEHFVEKSVLELKISGMYVDDKERFLISNDSLVFDDVEIKRHNKYGCPSTLGKVKRIIELVLFKSITYFRR